MKKMKTDTADNHTHVRSIWPIGPVTAAPDIKLETWQIYNVAAIGGRPRLHLIGWNATEMEGCTSSEIVALDLDRMVASTESGLTCKLSGPPVVSDNDLVRLTTIMLAGGEEAAAA